ncbi:hypothetical protein [Halorubrum pallidum]|uniref:Uncharacterized protein n=1 Tax=Halorubrum pallidum TaxID=1526114 RepID=A0ABD5T325_9EURY
MIQYLSVVGVAAVVATLLMVAAMLYLVWGAMGNDVHSPTPDDSDRLELDEGEESGDAKGELTADGNSA